MHRMRIILAAFWRFRFWVFTFQMVFAFFLFTNFVMHRLGPSFPFRFAPFVFPKCATCHIQHLLAQLSVGEFSPSITFPAAFAL